MRYKRNYVFQKKEYGRYPRKISNFQFRQDFKNKFPVRNVSRLIQTTPTHFPQIQMVVDLGYSNLNNVAECADRFLNVITCTIGYIGFDILTKSS